ncbi:alpha-glucosidase [uncultured Tateyamaria sp.]|uniref:glycoside hydrolase family 13 protein n=1 Tax=uncultured Tateyamaria sp. TaxID=455651 RepID=UPI00260224C4|nr:alpha-glucosidase [uncultured Tateyamaria sp.]
MTHSDAPWWKTATGYQIYPRSFCDSNGDGIGDIPGITSRLDHLRDLGIGFVWLSPVYRSPMHDNGYDISDYCDIAPEFGTLADFDDMVAQARARGIRIVMDLVVNHCSSEHPWFQAACDSSQCDEHDYFYWREAGPDGGPPDDQRSCFGGPAWIWVEAVGKYYFGFFGPQQPDLNWQNPALRQKIYQMMNWWLDRGIGGFRMDVIELIGKDVDARHYYEGPDMHRFIQEMHREALAGRDILTVGESGAVTARTALDYCGRDRAELNMMHQFNHIHAAWDPEKGRFGPSHFDLATHKRILADWQDALADDGWNALYLSNHDLPRPVSHYGDEGRYRKRSAKMLALVTYLMKGTPFLFQGEEIGMTNVVYRRIEQFRDIETLGQYRDQSAAGVSDADFIAGANTNGRDNARTPMQWNTTAQAGFTCGTPWIDVNPNYADINVADDRRDPDGIFTFYKALISMRKKNITLREGAFALLEASHPQMFAYTRRLNGTCLYVLANFSDAEVTLKKPKGVTTAAKTLLTNMQTPMDVSDTLTFAPYQACVLSEWT